MTLTLISGSTDIRAIGHNSKTLEMHIHFISGGLYAFYNVPISLYGQLMNAPSKGKFFHQHIRGRYGDTKIS